MSVLNHLSFTDEEKEAYEERLKWYRAKHDALKKQHEKGRAVGLAEGLKKGIEKGKLNNLLKDFRKRACPPGTSGILWRPAPLANILRRIGEFALFYALLSCPFSCSYCVL